MKTKIIITIFFSCLCMAGAFAQDITNTLGAQTANFTIKNSSSTDVFKCHTTSSGETFYLGNQAGTSIPTLFIGNGHYHNQRNINMSNFNDLGTVGISMNAFGPSNTATKLDFYKSRKNGSSYEQVQSDDPVAEFTFYGYTGTIHETMAVLGVFVDNGYTSGPAPGRYEFMTRSSDGMHARLTIKSDGIVRIHNLGAYAAGDVYVVADASGNLHKSSIGPGSDNPVLSSQIEALKKENQELRARIEKLESRLEGLGKTK